MKAEHRTSEYSKFCDRLDSQFRLSTQQEPVEGGAYLRSGHANNRAMIVRWTSDVPE